MGRLVTASDEDASAPRLSEEELVNELVAFFVAGTETAAATVAWALALLAQHPGVEQRVHEEARAVLGREPATGDHLPQLPLTHRVVLETLRLYPPGWLFTRTATRTTRLGGYTVPAGTALAYSPYVIHHRADLHPAAERFDPDRWDAAHRTPPPREAFLPFGGGGRTCIGEHFGTQEVVPTLATIAARWHLQLVPGQAVRPRAGVALAPRSFTVRAKERAGAAVPGPGVGGSGS